MLGFNKYLFVENYCDSFEMMKFICEYFLVYYVYSAMMTVEIFH